MESIAAVDPRALATTTDKIISITVTAWDRALSFIPTEELEAAYTLAIQTRESKSASFPLGAAEIALAWKRKTRPELKSAGEAWAIACEAIRKAPDSYSTGVPKRGQPKIDDPLIAKCVRSIGVERIAINGKNEAWKAFEWMYKSEAENESERLDVNPQNSLMAESERLKLGESDTLKITDGPVDQDVVEAVTEALSGEFELKGHIQSMKAMLGPLAVKPKCEPVGAVCGNCHYVRFKSTLPLTYFCNHESVRDESGMKRIGHDATIAPEWCPLEKVG